MKSQSHLAILLVSIFAAPALAQTPPTEVCTQPSVTDRENCRGMLAGLQYRSRQRELVRQMGPVAWPALPARGFIRGHRATQKDIETKDAVFSLKGTGPGALDIPVPQYALWRDEAGRHLPAFLVQAERAPRGRFIVGLRTFDGREVIAELYEIELLGTSRPDQ